MNKSSLSFLLSLPLLLPACSQIPPQAYYNHGTPESLLDLSSEAVTVDLNTPSGTDDLVGWINREAPARAELYCVDSDRACSRAKDVFAQFNVRYTQTAEPRNTAMLHYERVVARDCENRFIDNSINPYNLNHPTFGCSVGANIVQSVTDRRQFVDPALLDFRDAEKASQNYRVYEMPPSMQQQQYQPAQFRPMETMFQSLPGQQGN